MSAAAGVRRSGTEDIPRSRPAARTAWSLVGVYASGAILSVWVMEQVRSRWAPDAGVLSAAGEIAPLLGAFALFAVVGALIVSRRPRQPVGWVMLGAALAVMASWLASGYALLTIGGSPTAPPVGGLVAGLSSEPLAILGTVVLAVVLLLLLYPDGRLPSARWRPAVWATAAVFVLGAAGFVLQDPLTGPLHLAGHPSVTVYVVDNPLSPDWLRPDVTDPLQGVMGVGAGTLILVAVASVVVRFRGSHGVERQQIRWLAVAGAATGAVMVAMLMVGLATRDWPPGLLWMLLSLSLVGYPLAVGVAVLRYRLYEIDRIISRTVTYGLVLAVLGAVYAAAVVSLGGVLSAVTGQVGSDLVVAVSVLAVVAAFGPVRSRVQRAVDHRFNRTGYQARQAVDTFAQDLRDEVDLAAIRHGLVTTAAATVQPTRVSVWLAHEQEETP